nr:NAD(P)-binding domain-containing protein [Bacteroidota bacterium]
MDEHKKIIGVIGSGAMGAGIAQVAAAAGHRVIIYDSSSKALDKAQGALSKTLEKLISRGKIEESDAKSIFARIVFSEDIISFKNCTFIIEAIVENLETKQNMFQHVEALVGDDCILASN